MLKSQQSIDTMLAANARPQNTKSGSVILKSGNKRHTLLTSQGERTALGEYYEQKSRDELPVGGFDPTQAPFREGNTEYIKMRSGEDTLSDVMIQLTTTTSSPSSAKVFTLVLREITLCKYLLR